MTGWSYLMARKGPAKPKDQGMLAWDEGRDRLSQTESQDWPSWIEVQDGSVWIKDWDTCWRSRRVSRVEARVGQHDLKAHTSLLVSKVAMCYLRTKVMMSCLWAILGWNLRRVVSGQRPTWVVSSQRSNVTMRGQKSTSHLMLKAKTNWSSSKVEMFQPGPKVETNQIEAKIEMCRQRSMFDIPGRRSWQAVSG